MVATQADSNPAAPPAEVCSSMSMPLRSTSMNWWDVMIFGAACIFLVETLPRLLELSRRLRRVEQKLDAVLKGLGITSEDSITSAEYWKSLARDRGQKIQAIAAYRKETGAGLAEAKQAVEAWIEQGGK
jgi:hypothetical protein